MKVLGKIENAKDLTSQEFVQDYVEEDGGKINSISVDGVTQPISATKNVDIVISTKVDKEVSGDNGTSVVTNASGTAGVKFTHTDNTESFVGVDDAGASGISATMYAINKDTLNGARLQMRTDGLYYTKSATKTVVPAEDEVATIKSIPKVSYQIIKKDTAEQGFFASYYLVDKNSERCGAFINIPKDFLVKSAQIKTCIEDDKPQEGMVVGDKYIDFTINVKAGESEESHIYLLVNELVDVYTGGNGIAIDSHNEVTAVADTTNGVKVTTTGIGIDLASSTNNGAMSNSDFSKLADIEANAQVNKIETVDTSNFVISASKELGLASGMNLLSNAKVTKLDGISEGANKTESSSVNGNIKVDNAEVTVYTHPTTTAKSASAVKVGYDALGHVVVGNALALSDLTDDASHRVVTDAEKTEWGNKADSDDITSAISTHNSANDSHSDIRTLITDEASARDSAIATHNSKDDAHSDIRTAIATVQANLDTEVTNRTNAISNHDSNATAHNDIRTLVSDEASARATAISNEATARDNAISSAISGVTQAKLTSAITTTREIGGIASGTTFAVGTSLEEIIRQILA